MEKTELSLKDKENTHKIFDFVHDLCDNNLEMIQLMLQATAIVVGGSLKSDLTTAQKKTAIKTVISTFEENILIAADEKTRMKIL